MNQKAAKTVTELLQSRDLRKASRSEISLTAEAIYGAEAARVYRLALGYFHGDEDAAAELLQSVFFQIMNSLSAFRGQASFSTWVMRIAMRSAWRHNAKFRSTKELSADRVVSDCLESSELAAREERDQQVRRALTQLSEEHQDVLVLFAVKGLSHQEVADVLGIALGTAWSRLARARIALEKELKKIGIHS